MVSPIIRLFPSWWKARFYGRIAGAGFGERTAGRKIKRIRVGPHQYEMELQLDDPMERFAYFVGCYWGIDVTAAILKLLRKGDYFIDVGANLGFLTLAASRAVGGTGRVFAFEPLMAMADRLRQTLRENKIENVTVCQHALGDAEGEGTLDLDDHSSKANLRGHVTGGGEKIRILRGDYAVGDLPAAPWILAKLDVEGYELRVLRGFQSLVRRPRTAFLIEVTDEWLRELGGGAAELFELMFENGFKAYLPKLTSLSNFDLHPIKGPLADRLRYDVVFLRPEDDWLSR